MSEWTNNDTKMGYMCVSDRMDICEDTLEESIQVCKDLLGTGENTTHEALEEYEIVANYLIDNPDSINWSEIEEQCKEDE